MSYAPAKRFAIATGSQNLAWDCTYDGIGSVFFANYTDRAITELRASDGAYLAADGTVAGSLANARISTPSTTYGVAANATHVWAHCSTGIFCYERATRTLIASITNADISGYTYNSSYGRRMAWCGGYLWVTFQGSPGNAGFVRIDPSDRTFTVFRSDFSAGGSALNIASDGTNIWITSGVLSTNQDGGLVRIFNGTTGAPVTTISVGLSDGISYDPAGYMWISRYSAIALYNTSTFLNDYTPTIPLGGSTNPSIHVLGDYVVYATAANGPHLLFDKSTRILVESLFYSNQGYYTFDGTNAWTVTNSYTGSTTWAQQVRLVPPRVTSVTPGAGPTIDVATDATIQGSPTIGPPAGGIGVTSASVTTNNIALNLDLPPDAPTASAEQQIEPAVVPVASPRVWT